MNAVRSIESLTAGDAQHNLFRTLGPTLLISMAYIDLGKWLVAVDAGHRFGYDLVLLVLLFNFSAILCQYLSTCIGMVTGKNLAQICRQEYSQVICVVLGLQAWLSLLTSEITMISGMAVGFNLVFEYNDLITAICFASVVVNLLPYTLARLDKRVAGIFNACIAGFTLLCFVIGLLISHPQTPVNMNVMFPKLSGESAYSLMALLGANLIAHNFYTHSSIVQVQRRSSVLTLGSLFHDHLFSILFIFTGIFLVNYILLSSAADETSVTMVLNFQDAMELMHQIFTNPAAPIVLLVILLFSSHIISLTCIVSSDVISENFFGVKLPISAHHLIPKGFAMVLIIYSAKVAGPEGIYQSLFMCPVIQAMLLPSSVIPILRVSSSRILMGRYRMSVCVEILPFLAFLLALFTNIIFAAEILFGDSAWTNNLKGDNGNPAVLPYSAVVIISCASIAFTLFLAVTPLKSASNETETQLLSVHSQRETSDDTPYTETASLDEIGHEEVQGCSVRAAPVGSSEGHKKSAHEHTCRAPCLENCAHEEVRSSMDPVPRDALEGHQKSAFELTCDSNTTMESHCSAQRLTANTVTNPEVQPSSPITHEETKSVGANWKEPMPEGCSGIIVDHSTAENFEMKSSNEEVIEVETDVHTEKDTELPCNTPLTSHGPPSLTGSRGKYSGHGNVSGTLSKTSTLGRAARRQFAVILNEFWGDLFNYHGELTQEAKTKRFDCLIGLKPTTTRATVRNDNLSIEASWTPFLRDETRESGTVLNSRESESSDKEISSPYLALGLQTETSTMGSSTWSQSTRLQNIEIPCSGRNKELRSNFTVPSYSDNQLYQPATVHGYHLSEYLSEMNVSRGAHSGVAVDPRRFPRSSESYVPSYTYATMHSRDPNMLGSVGTGSSRSPTMNHLLTAMAERSYYDPSAIGGSENVGASPYSKKYHSSPDISAVIAANKNAFLHEANLGGTAANMPYLRRLSSEKLQYVDSAARSSSQLTFNELSEHSIQKDILSTQSMNTNTNSLWAQQPFEQLFGVPNAELNKNKVNTGQRPSGATKDHDISYTECEDELLGSFRFCIMKLLKLDGPRWIFTQNGGSDENLIDLVSEAERLTHEETSDDRDASRMRRLPNCGDDCIWRASLVVSFGVWCARRVLDLSLVENRPELWGKYTYVLNRLQGILDPAFSKPRRPLRSCACLEKAGQVAKTIPGSFTTAARIMEVIKGVEQAVASRKGRSGTAAGNVAFPKGKENLTSVLKRYKRRLSSMTPAGQ